MERMPVLFIGHGSPMNAIEDNEYTKSWEEIGRLLPKPKAILAISAHWYTEGTKITGDEHPKTIYDMYGFPKALYEIKYEAKGSLDLAQTIINMVSNPVTLDKSWGYDHGTWSILVKMFPDRDVPVVQLSVNKRLPAQVHYEIGRELKALRDQGVLIMGSGNVVHNLSMVDWSMEGGYDWADAFDQYVKENILKHNYEKVIGYETAGEGALKSVPTPEHYYPLLYILGAADEKDRIEVYNDKREMGALSMTSYIFIQ